MNAIIPNQEVKDCAICMEPMKSGQIASLACGTLDNPHQFHPDCLQQWMARNPICPLDRSRIRRINGEPVAIERNRDVPSEELNRPQIGCIVFGLGAGLILSFMLFTAATTGVMEFILACIFGLMIGFLISIILNSIMFVLIHNME